MCQAPKLRHSPWRMSHEHSMLSILCLLLSMMMTICGRAVCIVRGKRRTGVEEKEWAFLCRLFSDVPAYWISPNEWAESRKVTRLLTWPSLWRGSNPIQTLCVVTNLRHYWNPNPNTSSSHWSERKLWGLGRQETCLQQWLFCVPYSVAPIQQCANVCICL